MPVGYVGPNGQWVAAADTPAQGGVIAGDTAAALEALVSRAWNPAPVASLNNEPARVQGVFYGQQEGTGTTLADTGGFGPSITVGGTTAGIWANAGSLTHHSAGNTIRLSNLQYADSLIDMRSDCSILIGMDIYMTAWPTTTETMWGLHRPDTTGGGVRMVLPSASVGRFGLYYRPSGSGETEVVGGAPSTYLNRWVSVLTELRVLATAGELQFNVWLDGQAFRHRRAYSLGAPPPPDASGGICFSGNGSGPNQLLGSGGSGARTRDVFVFRHSGVDRSIGSRLAAHMAANTTLPTWLTRF